MEHLGKKHFNKSEIILKKAKSLRAFGVNLHGPLERNKAF